MKVLIVDDRKEELYLLETVLKGSGYDDVVSAKNGAEALEKLRADEDFDIIISDILMPVMDGFRFCTKVKKDKKTKHIPFAFYTATYKDERDEDLALEVGADRFIRKPTEPDELIKIIKGMIRDVREGKVESKKPVLKKDKEVLQLYSDRMVKKLEKKMLALEREITQREQAEEKAHLLAHQWQTTFDAIDDSVCLLDPKRRILQCNKAMMKFLDKPSSEIIGQTCWELVHGTSEPIEGCPIERMKKTHCRETMILQVDDRWLNVSADPLLDDTGGLTGAVHIISDITEQKRAVEELKKSEHYFRSLLHNIHEDILVIDQDYKITDINDTALITCGRRREDIIGSHCYEILHGLNEPCDRSGVVCKLREVLQTGESCDSRHKHIYADGNEVWVDVLLSPLKDEKGNVTHVIQAIRDVTERKQAEETLRERMEELERFREATIKREFRIKELADRVTELERELAK